MGTWNSRGLRGSVLEELINVTNDQLRSKQLALVTKVPTPIKPIEIDKASRHITLAYFDQKSTVDYIGVVQGIPICFDAKECASDTFPLQNVHEHQIQYMTDFEKQNGIAFIILYYTHRDEMLYVPLRELKRFWERAQKGIKKSFRRDELEDFYPIRVEKSTNICYLEALQKDLDAHEQV